MQLYIKNRYCCPSVSVTLGGVRLKENVDYFCRYSNNREIGTAEAHIYGMGQYAGQNGPSKEFEIVEELPDYKPAVTAYAGDKEVTLSWQSLDFVKYYGIYIFDGKELTALTENCTKSSYTVKNLTNGKKYTFLVRAYVGIWSDYTEEDLLTVTPVYTPKTEVTATPGIKDVTLSWAKIPGAEKYGVYRVKDGKYTKIDLEVTNTSYKVTGLSANTEYSFFVQAYKDGKWLAGGDKSTVTVRTDSGFDYPVLETVGGVQSVSLIWSRVPGAEKYGVYRYTGKKYVKIDLEVTGTSYTVTELNDDTEYTFFVQAYKDGKWLASGDESYASAKTHEALPYPALTATGGKRSVVLTWSRVNGAEKYGVYRYSGKKYTKIDLEVTGTSYTVTELDDDTEYTFFVQAYKDKWLAGGDESYATAKTDEGPQYPIVEAQGADRSVILSWQNVKGAEKYGVYRLDNGKYTKINIGVTDTSYTVTGLEEDTEYTFFVQAYKEGKWLPGGEESTASARTELNYPFAAAFGGYRKAELMWTKVDGAEKYGVYLYTGKKYTKIDLEVTGTSYTVTGLEDGTEYTFFVQAYKNGKWMPGADASYAKARTDDARTYPIVTAEGGDRQVTLTWTAVDGAEKYGVYRYTGKKYVKTDLEVTGTSYTVTGLEDGTEYTFFVQAYKDGKWMPGADASYAKAKTAEEIAYPAVGAVGGDRKATLFWTPVNNAEKYGVYRVENGKYKKIDLNVTDTSYTITGLLENTEYTFFIQAYRNGKWLAGGGKSTVKVKTDPGRSYPIVTAEGGDRLAILTWAPVSGAEKYGVYKVKNGKYTKIDLNVTDTSFIVNGLENDTEYSFFVQAYREGKWLPGAEESAVTVKTNKGLDYPVLRAVGGNNKITLLWSAAVGAEKYGVYRYDASNNKYTKIDLNVTDTSYTVTGLADNTEYTFFVQAYTTKWLPGSDESYAAASTN